VTGKEEEGWRGGDLGCWVCGSVPGVWEVTGAGTGFRGKPAATDRRWATVEDWGQQGIAGAWLWVE
jgi:hypothetical protein